MRNSVLDNRSQFYLYLTMPLFGRNRKTAAASEGTRQEFWREGI
jgi:non-heme chloroperoxidase